MAIPLAKFKNGILIGDHFTCNDTGLRGVKTNSETVCWAKQNNNIIKIKTNNFKQLYIPPSWVLHMTFSDSSDPDLPLKTRT